MRIPTLGVFALLLLLLPATAARAQSAPASSQDGRWSAWYGCWTPAAQTATAPTRQVCIVPAPDNRGVQMVSFEGDRELLNERFVGDDSPQRLDDRGCTGERASRWAAAGPRRFSTATVACAGEAPMKTSRLFALVAPDQWLDVQIATVAGREQVRTQRFWRSSAPPPESIADAVAAAPAVRPAATTITTDDVIEASRLLPSSGVEAWLAEGTTRVPVDRQTLTRLADARVSPAVIDLMVAIAYPRKFEVRRGPSGGGGGGGFYGGPFDGNLYPADWGYLDAFTYGFGFGYPYWVGNYASYPGGVFVQPGGGGGGSSEPETHGQVVNGLGYTRVQPREASGRSGSGSSGSSSGLATASSDGGGSSSGGGASSSGGGSSSGVSSSGYSGGGGTSTGLTAVPR
jgi:hypothetical protein